MINLGKTIKVIFILNKIQSQCFYLYANIHSEFNEQVVFLTLFVSWTVCTMENVKKYIKLECIPCIVRSIASLKNFSLQRSVHFAITGRSLPWAAGGFIKVSSNTMTLSQKLVLGYLKINKYRDINHSEQISSPLMSEM